MMADLTLNNMITSGEIPEMTYPENHQQSAEALRSKLREKLAELKISEGVEERIEIAADFMEAARVFHQGVDSNKDDSQMFSDFQLCVFNLEIDMNAVEIKRRRLFSRPS